MRAIKNVLSACLLLLALCGAWAQTNLDFKRTEEVVYFVHSNMPPILIIHGNADTLVPICQAQTFVKRCEAVGSTARLVVREGKGHGWSDLGKDMELFPDWFDQYLRDLKPKQ